MRNSWKEHVVAAAVSVCVFAVFGFLMLHIQYSRDRNTYLAREAKNYDRHQQGSANGLLLFGSVIASAFYVAIAVVPYQLTLAAFNSKRLSGED